MTTTLTALTTGFLASLGLIVAIGAQNAWVLRQGLRREHVGLVVAICVGADVVLMAAGTAGLGVLRDAAPWALEVLRWGGVAYLLFFAAMSLRSALTSREHLEASAARPARSVALTTLAVTLLNPHVYLDTLVMLGTVTNSFGDLRWVAAGGAMVASLVWFTLVGLGARALSGVLDRPATWRVIDGVVAVVMVVVAAMLAFG
ncbi:LysE/ArgO family amino acid transporter [Sanguibacter sp. HDW7]|uniref:LysE/ArgO family amino acid transporter n=1 Tax=Sanguibacter sp. HDW7 TaxID=2714931 RepID=UPI001F10629A|nr:LysE family transporter [Sanguibacter sp. HDW7]